jgi:ABC-type antimicrobial peptide transport system permease subunit
MEYSRKLVTKNWWQFFGLAIVLGLINVLGALVLGIGLLVTIPASGLAVYAAFESIVGLPEEN